MKGTSGHRSNVSARDRKSTRLNSSHVEISYAVFCLKKKVRYSNYIIEIAAGQADVVVLSASQVGGVALLGARMMFRVPRRIFLLQLNDGTLDFLLA